MNLEGYTLSYGCAVSKQRYHQYMAGMMDPWEIVLFYQDMIEAECLPQRLLLHAAYFVEVGLCRLHEKQASH